MMNHKDIQKINSPFKTHFVCRVCMEIFDEVSLEERTEKNVLEIPDVKIGDKVKIFELCRKDNKITVSNNLSEFTVLDLIYSSCIIDELNPEPHQLWITLINEAELKKVSVKYKDFLVLRDRKGTLSFHPEYKIEDFGYNEFIAKSVILHCN